MTRKTRKKSDKKGAGGRGRVTAIPLRKIQELARLGLRDLSKIARAIKVPRSTLTSPAHEEAVKEAFETGRVEFEVRALRQYQDGIKKKSFNPLLIFQAKQIGWTDKHQVVTGPGDQSEGAIERLRQLVAIKREQLQRESKLP